MNWAHLLACVAAEWNAAGVAYAVVHGAERYPDALGRDVDVLVARGDADRALGIARDVLSASVGDVVEPPPLWGRRLVAVSGSGPGETFELHLQHELRWRTVVVAASPRATGRHNELAIDPWAAWAKRVLLPVLSGRTERMASRPAEFTFHRGEEEAARRRLPSLLGDRVSAELIDRVLRAGAEELPGMVRELRRSATRRAFLRSPIRSAIWPLSALWRRVRMVRSPCAPVIAVVGADGVGKSTALEAIRAAEDWIFLGVVDRHWRPGLLPQLGRLAGRPQPTPGAANPPRREGGRFHSLRLAYYGVDVALGAIFVDRPAASRQRLVLYDRCWLDMAVDPARYGLRSPSGVLGLWSILPRPDRVIALVADPDRIFERKGEMCPSEIARQQAEWRRLAEAGRVHQIIDADRPVALVVDDLRRAILQAFLELNGPAPS